MTNTPRGSLRLQAVLANRRYSYGGQLPSEVEQNVKTQNFGNVVGGGIGQMQKIFGGGNGGGGNTNSSSSTGAGDNTTTYSGNDGSGGSGVARYQAIASNINPNNDGTSSNDGSNNQTLSESGSGYNDTYSNNPTVNHDNSSNLGTSDRLGLQKADYKEMIPYLEKWSNRSFDRQANYAGLASLSNAFGKTGGFSTVFGSYTPR